VHNTYYKNGFCYTSWYKDGYTIVDANRPHNLIQVGNYDAFHGSGNGFHGTWGVYAYLPSGNVLLTNIDTSMANNVGALFVVTPTIQQACYLEGNVVDSITNFPLGNVSISATQASQSFNDLSNLSGNFATGTVHSGLYNITFTKAGYFPLTYNNVNLQNGLVTNLNVKLVNLISNSIEENNFKNAIKIVVGSDKNLLLQSKNLNEIYRMQLFNIDGKELISNNILRSDSSFNLSQISSGIYFVKIFNAKNESAIFKVIL
jgi:hypothetical protein